jgi:spermidine synthase
MKEHAFLKNRHRLLTGFILVCFFLSGMTALTYQIVWMRLISKIIGGAPFAVSAVLAVFMSGLGIGGYVSGRICFRYQGISLIRIYGLLELTIAAWALFIPLFLELSTGFYSLLYNNLYEHTLFYNLFIFAGAFLIMSFPAICMGATLPVLCRFYVTSLSHLGSHAGRLYGLNTFGAAAGALVCGFWLISALGVYGAMLAAIAINAAIGLGCLFIPVAAPKLPGKGPGAGGQPGVKNAEIFPGQAAEPYFYNRISGLALVIFLVSGFCAMSCEVLWTRVLGLIAGPTTYSFTIVLATFIVGLALGNLVFGRIADKASDVFGLLVATQIAAAASALAASHILGNSQLFFARLIYTFSQNFALLNLAKAAVLFGFMLLPTFFFGAAFPLVARIYTRTLEGVGRSIGVIYAFNSIGDMLGAFCAGIVLIPLAGTENGLRLVIGLQLMVSAAAGLWYVRHRGFISGFKTAGAFLLAGAAMLMITLYPCWNRENLAVGKYHRFDEIEAVEDLILGTGWIKSLFSGNPLLSAAQRGELVYWGDGMGGFTAVLKYPGPFGKSEFSMSNTGKMDASSRGDMNTQTLLAHFPMLFSDSPENVMVLGLASGVTAGEVLYYPIKRLDVVDINDRVFEASGLFSSWNNNVLKDPRTRPVVQDALAHLRLTRTRYDAIISEPSNPWMAGMADLFTREFFQTAKNRLTKNGIYVQWFHCYQMDWQTFSLIGRTFASVFSNGMLVSCEPGGLSKDFLLVGFKGENQPDWQQARANAAYAQKSVNINLARPELIARMIVSENLNTFFGTGEVNTYNRPVLEYAAPKLMYCGPETRQNLLAEIARRSGMSAQTRLVAKNMQEDIDRQIEFAAYALSVHSPFENMVDLSLATSAQRRRYTNLLESYCAENPMDLGLVKDKALLSHLREIQIKSIKEKLPDMAYKGEAHKYLASLLADAGRTNQAVFHYKKALKTDPDDARSHNDLGFIFYGTGDYEKAVFHYKKALEIRPGFVTALGNMAFASLQKNQPEQALSCFKKILSLRPDMAESHYYAGQILAQMKRYDQAETHFKNAVRINPGLAPAVHRFIKSLQ